MIIDFLPRKTDGPRPQAVQLDGLQPADKTPPPRGDLPVSKRSLRGLDWFVFFVADIQTGFGPFIAVFLTIHKWTQGDIGVVLTISGLVALIGQAPFGALVDAAKSLRLTAMLALATIGLCAFAFAAWPIYPVVLATRVIHAVASTILGLTLVSISVSLVRGGGVSARLGRNAAFASAGTGIAAAVMGACGFYISNRAVFFLAGAMVIPAIFAVARIRSSELNRPAPDPTQTALGPLAFIKGLGMLARNRRLVIFAVCVMLFHLANAAMLPLAASMLTLRSSQLATIMVAAAIVVPQFTVTLLSPTVGRLAEPWGRRPLLIVGFLSLAIRGVLFAMTSEPAVLVLIQVLDGVSAAALGVLVPLTIVDLTRDSGRFNLAQGAVGSAMGVGAAISTTLTGYVADDLGSHAAFIMLTIFAGAGLALAAAVMPETRPPKSQTA